MSDELRQIHWQRLLTVEPTPPMIKSCFTPSSFFIVLTDRPPAVEITYYAFKHIYNRQISS